ncbi:phosphatase inhibitor-domain-containing protein [Hygrophoropsis aurantiaca]|uniref:Phosphatase inhibitor-domain-containing protein n=1 Tax=Hygrophoropsis aurantiaca TaxID=72124 RepID=A0ACB8ARE2_9AGAM|nr:phosphatase inhibitor-domain-containing protein [Hygrophoropsis aurantiaca]
MTAAVQQRPHTSAPGDGSRTITLRDSQPIPEDGAGPSDPSVVGSLRLHGAPHRARQRVAWGEDVIDNEGRGKKKSKICCIYHKPKRFDESSSEDSSDSDSDSSCTNDPPSRAHSHSGPSRGSNHHRHESTRRDVPDTELGPLHELSDSDSDHNTYERGPKGKKRKP